jgi:hypothetical protein
MLAVESARHKELAPGLFAKTRQWAELAGTRMLFDNAALWMALACRDEEPLEVLTFLRLCVVDTYGRRYWGNFEMILRPIVPALVRLGRHRPAAVLLGGLLGLAGGRNESIALATELHPQLAEVLGDELDSLLCEGQQLDRASLAQLAISRSRLTHAAAGSVTVTEHGDIDRARPALSQRMMLKAMGVAGAALAIDPLGLTACDDDEGAGTSGAVGTTAASSDAGRQLAELLQIDPATAGQGITFEVGAVLALSGTGSLYGTTMTAASIWRSSRSRPPVDRASR